VYDVGAMLAARRVAGQAVRVVGLGAGGVRGLPGRVVAAREGGGVHVEAHVVVAGATGFQGRLRLPGVAVGRGGVARVVPSFERRDEDRRAQLGDVGQPANVCRCFGVGRHAILLAREGFDVYGMDASANGLAFANEWAARESLSLRLSTGDMTDLPFADNHFDAVLSWNVVYHGLSAEIDCARNEILRCLKPHGHLILTLISTRHKRYGLGEEVEPHTFVIPGGGETSHPHRYFDQDAVDAYLDGFTVLRCEDVEQAGPDTYHWQIFARYDHKSA